MNINEHTDLEAVEKAIAAERERRARKPRSVWINIYSDGDLGLNYDSYDEALQYADQAARPVRFREVWPVVVTNNMAARLYMAMRRDDAWEAGPVVAFLHELGYTEAVAGE